MWSDWWSIPLGVLAGLVLIWVTLVAVLWLTKPDDAIIVALVLRSVTRSAGPAALAKHWPGSPEGLTALKRLCRIDGE